MQAPGWTPGALCAAAAGCARLQRPRVQAVRCILHLEAAVLSGKCKASRIGGGNGAPVARACGLRRGLSLHFVVLKAAPPSARDMAKALEI